jgi:hypothetical protein
MGKPTGFKEYPRAHRRKSDPAPERVKHYKEFEHTFETEVGEGARRALHGLWHSVLPRRHRLPGR